MTIARDPRTGAVLGQVTAVRRPSIPEMLGLPNPAPHITLVGRDGRYVTVPAHSVRLEELR